MSTISLELKKTMLKIARETIENRFFGNNSETYEQFKNHTDLQSHNGIFVTLKKSGDLRGCIGLIFSDQPLITSLRKMALQSAFHDPRFSPLSSEELNETDIEISVLTVPKDVSSYHDIIIGKDGIILNYRFNSALFLPQVATEQGWDLETTLIHLSVKAGLPMNKWKDVECRFSVFQADHFSESEIRSN